MIRHCIIATILLTAYSSSWAINPAQYFNDSYAVVIGVKDYQNSKWKNLVNAENDAIAMGELLEKQGFKVKKFLSKSATKSNITTYLEDFLAHRLKADDRLLFYFSGHGSTNKIGAKSFGYLIPHDGHASRSSTWIGMKSLRDLAEKLGNARHQLFILDACFGGSFATKTSNGLAPENNPRYLKEVTSQRARQFLVAGGDNEYTPALSTLKGYEQYSHYTAHLLRALREGTADTYSDGVLTTSELEAYLGPSASSDFNNPRGGHFPGHELGEFVFLSPKSPSTQSPTSTISSVPTKGSIETIEKNDDAHDWNRLSSLGNALGLQAYIDLHPNGEWVDTARERLEQLKKKPKADINPSTSTSRLSAQQQAQANLEWEKSIRYATTSYTIKQYLETYPEGDHVEKAEERLRKLKNLGK